MKVSCFSSQSLRGCIHRSRGLTPQSNKHFLSPIYDSAPRRFYRPSCLACQDASSYRQNLKLEERRRKEGLELNPGVKQARPTRPGNDWELSVGIEIHAELDTERKLFSSATTCPDASPNSNVALFDLAYPGSQPVFQVATLLPAIRAALALNCEIQPRSSFDRKHYLYPDQPAGYQITQFYQPYAKNGHITLYARDGIAPEDGESVKIRIKQVQMEQDTAKSVAKSSTETMLDFNRVSHPLIEIITYPDMHHPSTAAAYVRKVQQILRSVGAVTAGMEVGGLRADVNVSVRKILGHEGEQKALPTSESKSLGQRTEIKNLISFKAIEDAITSEKDRQIKVLDAGEKVIGETRGWTLGGKETYRLRGKEGEVDYRYMPDPDLGPLIISQDLISHVEETLPMLPDEVLHLLTTSPKYSLTEKDARILISFDDGDRAEYYLDVVERAEKLCKRDQERKKVGKAAGNMILHELGALLTASKRDWTDDTVPVQQMADLIHLLLSGEITSNSAKKLLALVFDGHSSQIRDIAASENFLISEVGDHEYEQVINRVLERHPDVVTAIQKKGQKGKIMWLVGQVMMEMGKAGKAGSIRPDKVRDLLGKMIAKVE